MGKLAFVKVTPETSGNGHRTGKETYICRQQGDSGEGHHTGPVLGHVVVKFDRPPLVPARKQRNQCWKRMAQIDRSETTSASFPSRNSNLDFSFDLHNVSKTIANKGKTVVDTGNNNNKKCL